MVSTGCVNRPPENAHTGPLLSPKRCSHVFSRTNGGSAGERNKRWCTIHIPGEGLVVGARCPLCRAFVPRIFFKINCFIAKNFEKLCIYLLCVYALFVTCLRMASFPMVQHSAFSSAKMGGASGVALGPCVLFLEAPAEGEARRQGRGERGTSGAPRGHACT